MINTSISVLKNNFIELPDATDKAGEPNIIYKNGRWQPKDRAKEGVPNATTAKTGQC